MVVFGGVAGNHLNHSAPILCPTIAAVLPSVVVLEVETGNGDASIFEKQINTIVLALFKLHAYVLQYFANLYRKHRYKAASACVFHFRRMLQGTQERISPIIILECHIHFRLLLSFFGNIDHILHFFLTLLVNLFQFRARHVAPYSHFRLFALHVILMDICQRGGRICTHAVADKSVVVKLSVGCFIYSFHLKVARHMHRYHLHKLLQCCLVRLIFRLSCANTVIVFIRRADVVPALGFRLG